jgi:hypothetical protein
MRWVGIVAGCLLAALLSFGCRRTGSEQEEAPFDDPVWFRDDTAKVGLDFQHEAGPTGRYFFPQIMGSGGALLDFDNDGLFDLYLIQNGGPNSGIRNRLFHQRKDGNFEDVSAGSGLDIAGHGMGVAVGDMDNDGWVDVYVSQYGGGRLFRNRGDGHFEDVTKTAGVEQPSWGCSCCFVDYDRDGWLDLVVVHYVDYDPSRPCPQTNSKLDYCHPSAFPGSVARLFHNRGSGHGRETVPQRGGRWLGFEDVTEKAGLARRAPGLGVVCADFNGDGWPDILAANDGEANHLWINRRDGTFAEEALMRGVALNGLGNSLANMGVTVGDVDGDGRLDVLITHLTDEIHTLWRQSTVGLFQDRTAAAGLAAPRWRGTGFGTILADFDLDGAPDIAVVNGRVTRGPATEGESTSFWSSYAERNQLFVNDGTGAFRDISLGNEAFCGSFAVSRGLIWGDFDNDGGIDLVATAIAGPARFYRNIAPRRGHWLSVRARDPALKRDAYGAVVTIRAGGRRWIGLVNPGQSYLSSGDPRAHFGLGAIEKVEEIRVDWPDGSAEVFEGGAVDHVLVLEHGKGRKVPN